MRRLQLAICVVTGQAGYVFAFVSGRPSLDLLGTLKWRHDAREEQLTDPSALQAWVESSTLQVRVTGVVDDAVLRRVVDFRETVYRVITAKLNHEQISRSDLHRLNAQARRNAPLAHLDQHAGVRQTGTVDQILTALVRDAFALLAGPEADRLRECDNPRCTRVYVDASRAGIRRWCGMTECGNAAKVAAFRARRHSPTEPKTSGHSGN